MTRRYWLVTALLGLATLLPSASVAQNAACEEGNAGIAIMQMTAGADPKFLDQTFSIGPGKSQTIVFGGIGQSGGTAQGCTNPPRLSVKVTLTWNSLPIGMPSPIEAKLFKGTGALLTSRTSSASPLTTTPQTVDASSGRTKLVIKNTGPAAVALVKVKLVGSTVK